MKTLTLEEIDDMIKQATTPSAPGDCYVADVEGFLKLTQMAQAYLAQTVIMPSEYEISEQVAKRYGLYGATEELRKEGIRRDFQSKHFIAGVDWLRSQIKLAPAKLWPTIEQLLEANKKYMGSWDVHPDDDDLGYAYYHGQSDLLKDMGLKEFNGDKE